MTVVPCPNCETLLPAHCPRCQYLISNMRRWRRVAEQLHAETCTHQARQIPSSCNTTIETIYNRLLEEDHK